MQRKKSTSIGDALERYLADSPLADGLRFGRICSAWDTAVGPSVAAMTLGKKYEGGVFTARLSSSVLRTQLQMNRETIRTRMNEILGDELIKTINLR